MSRPPLACGFAPMRCSPVGAQRLEFGNQLAVFVEQLLRMVAAQPLLEHGQVLRAVHHQRHLMRAEAALDLLAVHVLRTSPAPSGCAARSSGRSDGSCRRSRAHACGWRGFPQLRCRACPPVRGVPSSAHRPRRNTASSRSPRAFCAAPLREYATAGSGWRSCSRSGADRQNNAVRHRIEELVAVPRGCQRAVSASPSPTTTVAIRSGLSSTAPKPCAREYPSSPPS